MKMNEHCGSNRGSVIAGGIFSCHATESAGIPSGRISPPQRSHDVSLEFVKRVNDTVNNIKLPYNDQL